jgi:formamidopyrimidine-DNA glycosylase
MPEAVEVALFSEALNQEYGNHNLTNVEFIGGRFLKKDYNDERITLQFIEYPCSNISMASKGKFLYWSMKDKLKNSLHFFFNLAMTGSFSKEKQKHSAIRFSFDNGDVFFNDQRHFGSFRVVDTDLELQVKLNSLGWCPLKNPVIPDDFLLKIREHNHKKIGDFMMEQGKVSCGTGNYLRCEALYYAKLDPFRLISSLSDDEIISLYKALILIMQVSYHNNGATIKTYADFYGRRGNFVDQFQAYGRKFDKDNNPIIKTKDKSGRTIHWCPAIQK